MPTSQASLLSEHNEGNVRLFFFAAALGFLFPVIPIVFGTPVSNNILVVVYIIGILSLLFLGLIWPKLRRYLESRNYGITLSKSLEDRFTSAWAWLILVMFVGVSTTFVNKTVITVDSEHYDGSPLGIRWESANLVILEPEPNMHIVYGFRIDTKNVGKEKLTLKDAYLISGSDGTRLSMLVSTPPLAGIFPGEAEPILPDIRMVFSATFDNSPEPAFVEKWAEFSMIIQYNDSKERYHSFNRQWVIDQIKESHPESRPHVSKRQS
jgi:hypothetical protein